uniref:Uncharacterized protein n=1 Tax=Tanacetum cinerariifolium TaxID=118510 RepID=A0A699JGR7_TANCI|nr:hypothetical protein [Tanacetum cinerariifolium]
MVGEQIVVPAIKEVVEPIAKVDKEQVITLMADMEEEQMDVPMIDMEEDLAVLFGENDDFENDSEGVDEEEAWEVGGPSTTVAEGPYFPHLAPGLSVPPFMIEDLSTCLGNLGYGHRQLV